MFIKDCDDESAGEIFWVDDASGSSSRRIFYDTENTIIGTFPDTYWVEDWTGFDPEISRGPDTRGSR